MVKEREIDRGERKKSERGEAMGRKRKRKRSINKHVNSNVVGGGEVIKKDGSR